METINDRMQILVNRHYGGNKSAFARAIGMTKGGITSYLGETRRSIPGTSMIIKIIENVPCDARWLLTGKPESQVHTSGDYSPASGTGDISVVIGDAVNAEKVKHLEALIAEKDQRIAELKETIELLKK